MEQENRSGTLKRFLLHLPTKSDFKLTKDVKKQIRKALFMSISNEGKYLNWFFPHANSNNEVELVHKLDTEFSWKFQDYHKTILAQREPKVHTDDHHAYHGKSPCARIFRKGEPIYRCLTCAFDETCALCCHCFEPEYHKGHKINIAICQRENGGVCDCGDPEAWLKDFLCPYGYNNNDEKVRSLCQDIPNEFAVSFLRTIEILLDFVIDIMSQSDLQFEDPEEMTSTKIDLNSINSTLDPRKYDCEDINFVDSNNEKYYLLVYNDQIRYYRDAVQRIHLASRKVKEFAVMVTDKIQTSGRAKVIGSRNINLLMERQKILSATGLATCIRSNRDVFREDMCDEILLWLYDLTESEIFKVNDTVKDLLCRAFCGKWQNGLLVASKNDINYTYRAGTLDSSLKIPKVPSSRDPYTLDSHWKFVPTKWNLPNDVCEQCNYNITDQEYLPNVNHLGSRLQYLLHFDIRFWKAPRVLLHDIYSTSLITNLNYKNIICCQYVDIYPVVADMFLNMDREPELSVMCTLSTQLFTCPTNSTSIVQHGDVTRILASIYGFLTSEDIQTPENIKVSNQISIKSLKNRRWGQIFFDLGYILSRNYAPKTILCGNIIPMACDLFALFQGRPVMRREKTNHVEYESTDYTAFFHAISVVYQFGEYVAQSLRRVKYTDSSEKYNIGRQCIQYVLRFLISLENGTYPGLVDQDIDINIKGEKELIREPISGMFIEKRDDDDKVCFLHPLHSFLSWLVEYSDLNSPAELIEIFTQATQGEEYGIPNIPSTIFDYSIRTIVLMSQIKSGFWVRNGFSVRSQLQLYKNSALRENGYIRDLFLAQVFSNSNDPNLVCFQFLSRWFLLGKWSVEDSRIVREGEEQQEEDAPVYDSKTLPYIIEEFMYFLIHLLTENIYLKGSNHEALVQARIQKEIIHNLCFGGMNYTKLCSHIPDHLLSEKRFDPVLCEITTFKPPKGTNDLGIYHLKEEYLDEMNPYYFSYTTNVKDDAIKFVKNRIHKKTGTPLNEIVIEPYRRKIEDLGIYRYIGNFSASPYFAEFLIRALLYIQSNVAGEVDGLMETTLHLIHICSYEQLLNTEQHGTFYDKFIAVSEKYSTSIARLLYKVLMRDEYCAHHCKVRAIMRVFEAKYHNLRDILREQVPGFDKMNIEIESSFTASEDEIAKKKRIAKERQAKLLARFKKQQNSFIKKNIFEANDVDIEMEDCAAQSGWNFPEAHCMLCQNAAEGAGPFGLITYVSKTSEFRNVPFDDEYWFLKAFSDGVDLDSSEYDDNLEHDNPKTEKWQSFMKHVRNRFVIGPGFKSCDDVESKLVSSSCGHGMHFQCYLNFLNTNKNKSNQITRNTPENVEHKEFVCPLCKAINNMFIPILWTTNRRNLSEFLGVSNISNPFQNLNIENIYNHDWYDQFTKVSDQDIESMSLLTPTSKEMLSTNLSNDISQDEPQHQFRLLLSNMFQILSFLTFPQVFKADSIFVLVNTIKSIEIALRGTSSNGQLIINQLPNNCLINLRTLNEFRNTSVLMKIKGWIHTPNPRGDGYAKMLAHLFSLGKGPINTSILEVDFFECLVNILPLPSAGFDFHSILEMAFTGHLIQTLNLLTNEMGKNLKKDWRYSVFDIPTISNVPSQVADNTRRCFEKLIKLDEHTKPIFENEKFGTVAYSLLVKSVTPFLRRVAIYAYVQCANIESIDFSLYSSSELEADRLCTFLNLKSIAEYLQAFTDPNTSSTEGKIFGDFIDYLSLTRKSANIYHIQKKLEYPGIVKLVDLPERLDYFFTKYYYSDRYNNPNLTIEDPAVCLFCAEVVDAQKQAMGCIEGQCTDHYLKECPHDVGLFLLPKDRTLLLLHKNGGSFYNAPYLDEHGELADESKKSKALYFSKLRYDDFTRNVWLQHNVPNYIVRNLESVLDPGGWETL
ncbi:uncharacterized protein J8A68_003727 [[Candida] subhashii]|uniref:E3 ubiquitin-protein ligase n=1 Tax=[Candida] subhashii TaxID=561895 RepID=A0A8J5QIT4_9ASCO|nr:uncharacterized protein J8A68_003727 [[Candida] subhashii]KAG7662739.1 hypothetical protein J8A68_003727 [[Candida] subhashii]